MVNVVRGQRVPDAINSLNYLPQKVTDTVRRTILSAVHNLMDQNQEERFDEEQLIAEEKVISAEELNSEGDEDAMQKAIERINNITPYSESEQK